ncbi:MAG TPA: ferritin family protein [bacterium]
MTVNKKNISEEIEALATAIANELNGLSTYLKFARQTSNFSGKNMFITLASDELQHFHILDSQRRQMQEKNEWQQTEIKKSVIQSLLPKFDSVAVKGGESKASDTEALNVALKLEENSRNFYRKQAGLVNDVKAKSMYSQLAEMEDAHYKIILAERESVLKSGFWMDVPEFSVELPE